MAPRRSEIEPNSKDTKIWGNLGRPENQDEPALTFMQLVVTNCALTCMIALFGSLVLAGPWCNCGRACKLPTDIPNALFPICTGKPVLEDGGECNPSCRQGYAPSANSFLCYDQTLSPATLDCALDPTAVAARQDYSVRFSVSGAGPVALGPILAGCSFDGSKQVSGECFNECRGPANATVDSYNVWAVSAVQIENGWRPPDLQCCKNLFKSCNNVNANIKYRQYVALSGTTGICNMACVKLPPDEVRFVQEVVRRGPSPTGAPEVEAVNDTAIDEGPDEETAANVTMTADGGGEEEEEETESGQPASAMDQVMAMAKIDHGKESTRNTTVTIAPINQTAAWENYTIDQGDPAQRVPPKNALVKSLQPDCVMGVLFNPLCILFFSIFIISIIVIGCVNFCLFQQAMRDSWPSNSHHVSQQVFEKCAKPVAIYQRSIAVEEAELVAIKAKEVAKKQEAAKRLQERKEWTARMDPFNRDHGSRRVSGSDNMEGNKREAEGETITRRVGIQALDNSMVAQRLEEIEQRELAMKSAKVLKQDMRGASWGTLTKISLGGLSPLHHTRSSFGTNDHDDDNHEGTETDEEMGSAMDVPTSVLNCPKRHGLEKKAQSHVTCRACGHEGVRFIPYRTNLEVVDFFICTTCDFYVCERCAMEFYVKVFLKGIGKRAIAKLAD